MDIRSMIWAGQAEVVGKALRGELDSRRLGWALKGAWKYARAVAAGDEASPETKRERAQTCAACPLHTARSTRIGDGGYCGTPLVGSQPSGACGCLVTITVDGETRAAGKSEVASMACPLGKWAREESRRDG